MAWKDEDWIGQGRIYTAFESHPTVLAQRKSLFDVPASYDSMRALPRLSVMDLLKRLEFVIRGTSKIEVKSLFSPEPSNAALEALQGACILPPSEIVLEMVKEFGQLWFDGKAKSIKDWTKPSVRYPLSALTLYLEFNIAFNTRCEWLRARSWMNHGRISPKLEASADLARKLMFAFNWDAELHALGTNYTTNDLLKMLSDSWLTDSHIDMLLQVLTNRLEHRDAYNPVILAPCVFQMYLQHAFSMRNEKTKRAIPPLLDQYRLAIESRKKTNLLFVAHINGNHWVAWKVDFIAFTYGHGDSLELSEEDMGTLRKSLEWWLGSFDIGSSVQFTYQGNILAHGDQVGDSFSCGIVSYNAIAHDLFGDELWTVRMRKIHRIECFNAIVMTHNQMNTPPHPQASQKLTIPLHASYNAEGSCCPQAPRDQTHEEVPDSRGQQNHHAFLSKLASDTKADDTHHLQVPRDQPEADTADDLECDTQPSCTLLQDEAADSASHGSDCSDSWVEIRTSPPLSTSASNSSMYMTMSYEVIDSPSTQNMDVDMTSLPAAKREREPERELVTKSKKNKHGNLYDFFSSGGRANARSTQEMSEAKVSDNNQQCRTTCKEGKIMVTSSHTCVGQSRSALHSKKLRAARLTGTQSLNATRLENFKAHIRFYDRDAGFNPAEWSVQHSRCRKWLRMKSAYSPTYFVDHIRRCKTSSNLHDFSFDSLGNKTGCPVQFTSPSWSEVTTRLETRSCAGLSASHDPRIASYLYRPTALGGGGRSKSLISKEQYGTTYGKLKKRQKEEVDRLHETHWLWVIKHQYSAVFSTSCVQTVSVRISDNMDEDEDANRTCANCFSLLQNKRFRTAISLPEPKPSNTKFVNKKYQHEEIGVKFARCKGVDELLDPKNEDTRLAVRYAKGIVNGKFKEHEVFTGLVNVVMQRQDREQRGKKMTNFKYPERFDEFVKTLFIVAPRSHKLLSNHFPVRTAQSIRDSRAKELQFMPGISEQSFELVEKYVTALNVPHRVVAVSADDTKLFSAFKPLFDKANDRWCILGGTGDPLIVGDPKKLREELESADIQMATKVRIWVASIPIPKIPPLVIAAVAITDSTTAETLNAYMQQILEGLEKKNIWVVSYACDGTEKERANQRLMLQRAHAVDTRLIRSPNPIVPDLSVNIPLYNGKPCALIQDSAHMLKTGRNNLQSGARTLVLGNYYAGYDHLRDMAFDSESPLYIRDVEKGDKQDDRAAARVCSSISVNWLETHGKEYRGTSTYIFIFGELVDGYQSRSANISERLTMILRAYYFFQIWQTFLEDAKYPFRTACISREALDIAMTVIKGFLALVFIYRDYMGGASMPLIPWLHSSEACEHMFAECRKHNKDFDFAAFVQVVPKAQWAVRYSMNFGISTTEAKARASGYAHKWFDMEGIALNKLVSFPSDDGISRIARTAYDEAEQLWDRLGVIVDYLTLSKRSSGLPSIACIDENSDAETCDDEETKKDIRSLILRSSRVDDKTKLSSSLPSLSSWYPSIKTLFRWLDENDDEILYSLGSERRILEDLVTADEEVYTKGPPRLASVEDQMLNLSCAKHILDLDVMMRVDSLPMPTNHESSLFMESCRSLIGDALADSLPSILDVGPGIVTLDAKQDESEDTLVQIGGNKTHLDFSLDMVGLRKAHETQFAKKAVRTGSSNISQAEKDDAKARYDLIRKISETLRLQQVSAPGTGVERRVRWQGDQKTGNAANAETAARTKAASALSKRAQAVAKYSFSLNVAKRLANAGISGADPLYKGSFAIVYHEEQLLLARVLAVYARAGTKNKSNSWVHEASSIGQISYVAVQLYERARGSIFRSILRSRSHLRVKTFLHISPFAFMCRLPIMAIIRPDGNTVELALPSYNIWLEVEEYAAMIPHLVSAWKKRKLTSQ